MRAAGTAIVALAVSVAALPAQEPNSQDLLKAIEKQLRAANETAGPSVACVVVSRSDRYPKTASADQPGKLGGYDRPAFLKANPSEDRLARALDLSRPDNIPDHGYACGVVIDPTGLILTPYHVVDGATKIYVYLPGRAGSYADIHAADARYDLAVLKLITPPERLPALKFADAHLNSVDGQRPSLFAGKLVVVMANPYTASTLPDKPPAALGSVTKTLPSLGVEPGDKDALKSSSYYYFGPFLEYDAKLNAGVSGAALLNLDGQLVGLTTSAAGIGGERGPSFAFPADENFRRVVEVLRRGEEVNAGYLGISVGRNPSALLIDSVVPLGPAARAGLEPGDIILQINGVQVRGYDQLLCHIGAALADAKVKLVVARQRREREAVVTLGKFSHTQPVIASVRPDPVFGLRVDYGSILAQPGPGGSPPGNGVPPGVCVRELVANSPAATAFKKLGEAPKRWLITQVNGTAVTTPAEFYAAAKGQTSVKLTAIDPAELNRKEREVTLP